MFTGNRHARNKLSLPDMYVIGPKSWLEVINMLSDLELVDPNRKWAIAFLLCVQLGYLISFLRLVV